MKYPKLVFCSVLAITYSNFVWANGCDAVDDKVLNAMAKAVDVRVDEIAIDGTFYDQNFDTDVLDLITIIIHNFCFPFNHQILTYEMLQNCGLTKH